MNNLLSVWLVPAKNDDVYLRDIINNLGKEYGSPTFNPHLTLFPGINIKLNTLKSAINDIFTNVKPFKIKKIKIDQSEAFFKTVFIEFELDEKLKNLYLALTEKINNRDVATFKPHISLMYKIMPEEEKLKIIEKLELKDEFLIDKIVVNAPRFGDKDFLNIENWRELYEKKLND